MSLKETASKVFSQEQLSVIEEAFATFDANKDGLICLNELGTILKSLGMEASDSEVAAILDTLDDDGDGHIDFHEFVNAIAKVLTDTDNEQRIKDAFSLFDKDGNGYITPEELWRVMHTLGQRELRSEDILEMIKEADLDQDGKISFDEFKKLMTTV